MPLKTTIQLNTLQQLNEYFLHHFIFTYNYGCQINFYTNKKVLYESVYSNDYLPNVFLYETFYKPTPDRISQRGKIPLSKFEVECLMDNFLALFNTPNQYYSGLHYWLRDFNKQFENVHEHNTYWRKFKPIISFAEVYHTSPLGVRGFIARHFIRNGTIVPLISEVEDRSKCSYIRLELVKKSPTLNWKAIMMDSFWGREKPVNDYEFFKKYK